MKTMTVGELKAGFSEALDAVKAGETIVICGGRNHHKVAAIIPCDALKKPAWRTLGALKGKAGVKFAKDFAFDDEAMLAE